MNYTRFNNFVSDYESKLDEESNSTNDERLQKSLAENANEYVRRSELGSGLLSGAEATYHGREYIKKAKGTYDTLKKLPQTIEDKLNKFKGDVEGGVKDAKQVVSDAKNAVSQAKDAVEGLPQTFDEGMEAARQTTKTVKGGLEEAVQSVKQNVQDTVQTVKDTLNTGGYTPYTETPGYTPFSEDTPEDLGYTPFNETGVESPDAVQAQQPRQISEEEYNDIYNGDIQPQQRKFPLPEENPTPTPLPEENPTPTPTTGEIQSNYHFPPKDPKDIRRVPPNKEIPTETTNLNQEITTAGKETEAAGKKAEDVAGKLQKGAKLASKEEEIGEGAGELEEDTGGVLSDVILPIAAASMVGYAIYDLFDNKPKESIIAPKNPLVVPPKFTQQKEALATTSSLPQ